jgi:hypothetical protein
MTSGYLRRPDSAFSVTKQRRPREKDKAHLIWLATLPCAVCGSYKDVEAAHYRSADRRWGKPSTGMGEKPHDRWALPLCAEHHRLQHSTNEEEFWKGYGIDAPVMCLALFGASGDDEAAQQILQEHRG